MQPFQFFLSVVMSTSFVGTLVWAQATPAPTAPKPPVVHKDWMSNQGPDEVFAKDSCLAATNVASGTHRAQLLLSFGKDRLSLPQLLLKVWDSPSPEQAIAHESQLLIKTSDSTSYPLFLWKASTSLDEPSLYWYAPIGWSPLLDFIAGAQTLSIQGITTRLEISLHGSSASLADISTCLKSEQILPTDFLKKINAKTVTAAEDYASVDEMIQAIEKNFQVYRDGLAQTQAVANLRQASSKLLGQETDALVAFNDAQSRFQKATDNLNAQVVSEQTMEKTLAQTQANLQKMQTDLPVSQADAAAKKAIYDPVRKQFQVYLNATENAQDALDSNINDAANLRSRINQLNSLIPSLRNEQEGLRSRINSLQSDVNRARSDYDDADRNARNYDVESETRRALSSDFMYANYCRDAETNRRDARRFDDDYNRAHAQEITARNNLAVCKQDPTKDCSQFDRDNNEFDHQADEARHKRDNALSSANSNEYFAKNRADSIRSDKQRIQDDFNSKRNDAQNRYNGVQNDLNDAINRSNEIGNELPDLRSELSEDQNRLPQVQAQRPGLEQQLAAATQNQEQARVSLNYDRIEKDYRTTAALVDSIQTSIEAAKSLITKTEKSIKTIKPVIVDLGKELDLRTQRRDAAAVKLAPIQAALKPMRDQEALLNQTIADLASAFELNKARYQRTYEHLVTPVPSALLSAHIVIGGF